MYTDMGLTVPDSFQVNEGGIIVHGSAVHVESPLGKSWSFSVQEADRNTSRRVSIRASVLTA